MRARGRQSLSAPRPSAMYVSVSVLPTSLLQREGKAAFSRVTGEEQPLRGGPRRSGPAGAGLRWGSRGQNCTWKSSSSRLPRRRGHPPAGAGWLRAQAGFFSPQRAPVGKRRLPEGLSVPSVTEPPPGAEKVAAAASVAPRGHQNVMWGRKMRVSVNPIMPKCFSFWELSPCKTWGKGRNKNK